MCETGRLRVGSRAAEGDAHLSPGRSRNCDSVLRSGCAMVLRSDAAAGPIARGRRRDNRPDPVSRFPPCCGGAAGRLREVGDAVKIRMADPTCSDPPWEIAAQHSPRNMREPLMPDSMDMTGPRHLALRRRGRGVRRRYRPARHRRRGRRRRSVGRSAITACCSSAIRSWTRTPTSPSPAGSARSTSTASSGRPTPIPRSRPC